MKPYILCITMIILGLSSITAQYKEIVFPSEKLGEARDILLHIPKNYDAKKQYPLILVLDADYLFNMVTATVNFFVYNDEMPECIVVGIRQEGRRNSDCSYNEDTGFPKDKDNNFFEFVGMELLSSLAKKYNLSGFNTIIGHGLTANFTNYYLFKDHPLFDAYINIEPSFAPNVESYLSSRLSTLVSPRYYYLMAAQKNRNPETATRISELHTTLRAVANDNLRYNFQEIPDSDTYTVAGYAIPRALYSLFERYRPIDPEQYRKEILVYDKGPVYKYLDDKYRDIGEMYHISKKIRLNDIMAIYAAAMAKEDLETMENLARLGKKDFPDHMIGYFFEAEYHEKSGNTKKALRTYEKAFLMKEIDFMTKDMVQERIFSIKKDMGW
ncbi:hypothetical protein SAMN02927921_01406 [Sinomicrobium oceani]|uniref:Esterase n=1 Tax=Sinomicrobium oceani TaxID=1150368 RepID=A0A1K1NRF4_9FLAO|nr:alpha/beta hydrolase-fold protein [Sinomicrobium oceani]SFW38064.1 hypothetical protein SAMN02927921_01406 [Sinomicrobium oceani]